MKYILTLILLTISFTCEKEPPETKWQQVYDIVRATKSGHYTRKVDCIMKYSTKYSDDKVYINPVMVAHLGDAESDHRHYLTNYDNTCFGEYQISTNHWLHLIFYVDNKELGTNLIARGIDNPKDWVKYFTRIGYNTEMCCIILRDYKIRYKTWSNALTVWGGWRTAYGKKHPEKRDRFINKVIGYKK